MLGFDYDHDIDAFFPPDTTFYHLRPDPGIIIDATRPEKHGSLLRRPEDVDDRLLLHLRVPVLDLDRAGYVKVGTGLVVWVATVWILWLLGRVVWRDWVGDVGGDAVGRVEKVEKVKRVKGVEGEDNVETRKVREDVRSRKRA